MINAIKEKNVFKHFFKEYYVQQGAGFRQDEGTLF